MTLVMMMLIIAAGWVFGLVQDATYRSNRKTMSPRFPWVRQPGA
jgi:hypothetical protein